ncbi:hypothetical protein M378DRAFT_13044 [Amanita muscaria Koide BX008]|uniref:Uncharacterized protein n=1 Tax=Amanita muscaria (strain Koide BX008) TaxID=946122 RepID=A0A0C2X0L3_AMAMK|nr:hypothetical protein M378DRAFT_13044 [Amanita muscaria Koide BX008]
MYAGTLSRDNIREALQSMELRELENREWMLEAGGTGKWAGKAWECAQSIEAEYAWERAERAWESAEGVQESRTGLANIDPTRPPNCAQRVNQGCNSFVYLLDQRPIHFHKSDNTWRYNSDNQPVSTDEFWTPQTRGRPPNDSVEHNQKFYWQKQELYFDQSTDRWRTEDGNHPAPDKFFEGEYTPGNPDKHILLQLMYTQSNTRLNKGVQV